MALTSALFTGLSGLDVNQTQLNVVGNNIANANTVAFKASRALFSPAFYVTEQAGTPSTADFGGTNPSQLGQGATVAAVEKDWTQGAIQTTGVDTDLAINGAGFFVVSNSGGTNYTRDGSFTLNDKNQLVNTSGQFVQGYGVDSNFSVIQGALQNVTIPVGQETIAQATQNISLQGNLDSSGALSNGSSLYFSQPLFIAGGAAPTAATALTDLTDASGTSLGITAGQTFTLSAQKGSRDLPSKTFTVTSTSTLGDLTTFFSDGLGIDSSVPALSTGDTPGITLAPAAGDTGGTRIEVLGNTGAQNELTLSGTAFASSGGTSPLTFESDLATGAGTTNNPVGESVHLGVTAYDSLGTPIDVDVTATLESRTSTGTTWRFYASSPDNQGATPELGNGTLTFNNTGQLVNVSNNTITVDRAGTGATPTLTMKLDFSGVQSLSDTTSTLVSPSQDGFAKGTLSSFSIGEDGIITGAFSNGLTRTVGQVALATFGNSQGLTDLGNNEFTAGGDSGQAVVSVPGQLGSGTLQAGALEQSNVDISKEFVNMIISSTGFSAASRVISTSDQLITDLLNSSR